MKKIFLSLFVVLTMLALSACANDIQSTDLSRIMFDRVSVGDAFEQIKTDKYTLSTRYPEDDNTYNYEEWRVSVDGDIIAKITASFETITISVNGRENCRSIDDIISILGKNYDSYWYDKEQGLMQIEYWDKENKMQCIFVYDKNSSELVLGIMQAVS